MIFSQVQLQIRDAARAFAQAEIVPHAADTCQIALEGLEVPEENMLGAPGAGYRIALAYLENGRIGVAAQAVGVARAAFEAALRYAREREAFGKAIIGHQAIEFKLAEMATALEAARQFVLSIYEGTNEMQRLVIGRALEG